MFVATRGIAAVGQYLPFGISSDLEGRNARTIPDIFIYSSQPLSEPRQDLEDDLDLLLGGSGESTGGGSGAIGWNIDLVVFKAEDLDRLAQEVLRFLRERPVPSDTFFVVWRAPNDETRIPVYEG